MYAITYKLHEYLQCFLINKFFLCKVVYFLHNLLFNFVLVT